MQLRSFVLTILLLLAAAPHGQAAPGDARTELALAQKALAARDYPAAHAAYARHAEANPLAAFTMGLFEQQGWGRPVDPKAACAWFDKAAQRNIPAAQQLFGDCLAQGIGRAADGPAAVRWYRQAAAAGISYALCSAGDLYIAGTLLPRDVAQGLALCTTAAQAESPPAMLKLADYYREGTRVPANARLARFWYDQAAQRHNHEAQFRLGVMLSEGEGGAADPALARFWLEHAATEGYAPAYLPTAILYANAAVDPATGALAPNDLAKIYMWIQAAKAAAGADTDTADAAKPGAAARLAEIARIDALVAAVMPSQWQPELDRRVAEHLSKFGSTPRH